MSQSDELAFLSKIRETPDDDIPRLVFADWLDEHRQHERAELIRVSCELEPMRDQLGSERIEALRQREMQLENQVKQSFRPFFEELLGPRWSDVDFVFRRGCIETVAISVQWFLHKGERILNAIPTIRRADLFCVNGWGERLAECPSLASLEELEIAGWVGDDDILAMFRSPHLTPLRMIRFWPSLEERSLRDAIEAELRTNRLSNLREIQSVWGRAENWDDWPHSCRVRSIDPWARPFRFGPGGLLDRFFPGWLPDGNQMMALMPPEGWDRMNIEVYNREGRHLEDRSVDLPEHLFFKAGIHDDPTNVDAFDRWVKDLTEHLRTTIGYRPGLIALREHPFTVIDIFTNDCPDWMGDHLGITVDPVISDDLEAESDRGIGLPIYDWFTRECFTFYHYDRFSWRVDGIRGEATPM